MKRVDGLDGRVRHRLRFCRLRRADCENGGERGLDGVRCLGGVRADDSRAVFTVRVSMVAIQERSMT